MPTVIYRFLEKPTEKQQLFFHGCSFDRPVPFFQQRFDREELGERLRKRDLIIEVEDYILKQEKQLKDELQNLTQEQEEHNSDFLEEEIEKIKNELSHLQYLKTKFWTALVCFERHKSFIKIIQLGKVVW